MFSNKMKVTTGTGGQCFKKGRFSHLHVTSMTINLFASLFHCNFNFFIFIFFTSVLAVWILKSKFTKNLDFKNFPRIQGSLQHVIWCCASPVPENNPILALCASPVPTKKTKKIVWYLNIGIRYCWLTFISFAMVKMIN